MNVSPDTTKAIAGAADLLGCSVDEVEAMLKDERERAAHLPTPLQQILTSATGAISAAVSLSRIAERIGNVEHEEGGDEILDRVGWNDDHSRWVMRCAVERLADSALDDLVKAGRLVGWDTESNCRLAPPQ